MTTRRTFLAVLPAATLALTVAQTTSAQAAKLEESDSMALPEFPSPGAENEKR